jgi:hypothetical protein
MIVHVRFYVSTQTQLMVATILVAIAALAVTTLVLYAMRQLREILNEAAAVQGQLLCRNCKCKWVHRSLSRGVADTFLALFACVPYRCKICNFRFYVRRSYAGTRLSPSTR